MSRLHFLPDWKAIWGFLRDGKSDWKPKAIAVAAIVYLIWPVDLMPDLAPLIGWLDDIGFVGFATWYLMSASTEHQKQLDKQDKNQQDKN